MELLDIEGQILDLPAKCTQEREHLMCMLFQPGRIFARDIDEAVMNLRDRYGDGRLVIYPAHVQPRRGWIWFEFYIEVEHELLQDHSMENQESQDSTP